MSRLAGSALSPFFNGISRKGKNSTSLHGGAKKRAEERELNKGDVF